MNDLEINRTKACGYHTPLRRKTVATFLPVSSPPVFIQELFTGVLEVNVGHQILDGKWCSRERIRLASSEVFLNGCAFVGFACFCLFRRIYR